MKQIALLLAVLLFTTAVLITGCQQSSPTAVQILFGELTGWSVPLEGYSTGNLTNNMTIQTAKGPQTIQLAANTTYTLDGKACSVEDIGKALTAENTTYNCTVVVEPCEPGIVARYLKVFTITK